MPIKSFSKDPADVDDFSLNFGPTPPGVVPYDPGWLAGSDFLIGTPVVTITGPDNTLVLIDPPPAIINDGTGVIFWLSGGTTDVYTVSVLCNTAQGRVVKKSVAVTMRPG